MPWRRLTQRPPFLRRSQGPDTVYRIAAGLFFLCVGVSSIGALSIPPLLTGVLALVAGAALFAGY
jgi:hypothetical protein